jgi:hypothetical protein
MSENNQPVQQVVDIATTVIDSSPAGVAATVAAIVTAPDDQTEIAVRPPQAVIDRKKKAYSRAYWCENFLGKASIVLFIGTAAAVFASTTGTYDSDWLHSRYGKATGALGFTTLLSLYGKRVASQSIKDLGRWLRKYDELEAAYLSARGEDAA